MSPTARGAGFTSQSPSVRRLRMRAGTPAPDQIDQVEGMPSPHAGGDARAGSDRPGQGNAVSACGRGRPRTQDARGSIILPIALSGENARAPQGLPCAQGGLQPARATSRPRRRALPCIAEGFSPMARAHSGFISQSPSAPRLVR